MEPLQTTTPKSFRKPALTLFLASPFLAELLSSSSPANIFFQPAYFLLQLVSYGIPVLIIRELTVRWKLGMRGMFLLGLGYGIFNEGLLAKTFFSYHLSLSWMVYISSWHALHAIVFPILLTYFFYPEAISSPWITKRTFHLFVVLAFLESVLLFNTTKPFQGRFFIICWLVIIMLACVAKRMPGKIKEAPSKKFWLPLLLGIGNFLLYLIIYHYGLIFLSWSNLVLIMAILVGTGFILWKKSWFMIPAFLWYACGSYIALALFAMTGGSPLVIFTSLIFIVLFVIIIRKIRERYADPIDGMDMVK